MKLSDSNEDWMEFERRLNKARDELIDQVDAFTECVNEDNGKLAVSALFNAQAVIGTLVKMMFAWELTKAEVAPSILDKQ